MHVHKVHNNYGKQINTKPQNILNNSNINFQAAKQQLVPISADSFKSEYAKKICSKMQRYFKMLGESGSIKDVKLMHETIYKFTTEPPFKIDLDADVCLSIIKGERNSLIKLYHRYTDPKKKNALILNAALDKNGQMFRGEFFPEYLIFERGEKNIRRMYSTFKGDHYLPAGNNDREWSCFRKSNPSSQEPIDDSERGVFEIFIELARLKTSIM